MKYFFLSFLLFFNITNVYSQANQTKNDNDEIILPNNKQALNDLLEEIKLNKIEADKKVRLLNNYLQSLLDFKSRLSSFDRAKVETIFNDLNTAIVANSNDDILLQEGALNNLFRTVAYYSPPRTNDEENIVSRDFINKIEDALKPIKYNPILNLVSNSEYADNPKPVIDNVKLQQLKTSLSSAVISDMMAKLNVAGDAEITQTQKNIDAEKIGLETIKSRRSKIMVKLNEEETQINDLAIKLGLPFFCLTILALFLVPSLINRHKVDQSQQDNSQNVLLEISTVLLLTMSILILGLSGKIQSDVLGTLIGGISGYVLNRIRSRSDMAPALNGLQPTVNPKSE